MKKSNRILQDHKKVGTKLIPPLKQIEKVQEVSFADNGLPNVIWISALFQNLQDKEAINVGYEFIKGVSEIENLPNYNFVNLENFLLLNDEWKNKINRSLNQFIKKQLFEGVMHLSILFEDFPLNFLFSDFENTLDRRVAIEKLKFDVKELLNRQTHQATKVQVTAVFLMMVAGKLDVPENLISIDDFNAIFLDPESENAKRVASFARALLNGRIGIEDLTNRNWINAFWHISFFLDECEYLE